MMPTYVANTTRDGCIGCFGYAKENNQSCWKARDKDGLEPTAENIVGTRVVHSFFERKGLMKVLEP